VGNATKDLVWESNRDDCQETGISFSTNTMMMVVVVVVVVTGRV